MKHKNLLAAITLFSAMLCPFAGHAMDITATNSGNWGDPTIWNSGTVPGTNDDADVPAGFAVTVTTNASVQFIYDNGTVTMAANSTLTIVGDGGADGDQNLGFLDTSATGNTVIFTGNAFWAKHQNYYNLVLNGAGNWYTGNIGNTNDVGVAITIAGDMTVSGSVDVQQGDPVTVDGDLILGGGDSTNIIWDCSSFNYNVLGNTIINSGAEFTDNDSHGTDNFNNLTVNPGGTLYLLDSTNWYVSGNFTNNSGNISGIAYAQINFKGTGNITGTPFTLPTFAMTGTYLIGTTINLNTNTPTVDGGTLEFDLANPQQITLATNAGSGPTFYYSTNGNLVVINSGPSPSPGANFQFFSAQSYGGMFASTTLPNLPNGLSWSNSLLTNGTITVIGSLTPPALTGSRNGGQLTLSWNSTMYPGYQVEVQTNKAGLGGTWTPIAGGTVSPYMITINPTNPPVYFRLSHP